MSRQPTERMRQCWDRLAAEDAMHFIATRRRPWTAAEFFASGAPLVESVMGWIGPDAPRRRMLEIGCGMGRATVHFASHFERVDAIDISAVMIEEAGRHDPPANVRFAVTSGADLRRFEDGTFDLAVSFLVFQHIPDELVIGSYAREIGRVLSPAGRAVLQFDTRPRSILSSLYHALPDRLLAPTHRRYTRRYRRQPAALEQMFGAAGLEVLDQREQCSPHHCFLLGLRPPSSGAP